jgi:hypothetical protein
MQPSQLDVRTDPVRGGVDVAPRPHAALPTWRCAQCGLQQPRIEALP